MTGKGCHANPLDSGVTSDTPVAPSDGNAVPATGYTLRRLAAGYTDTDTSETQSYGCGQAAVDGEANQPVVEGNGLVINFPCVGGLGAVDDPNGGWRTGTVGSTATNSPGGGGSGGAAATAVSYPGDGGNGTCFSGGAGGGGIVNGGTSTDDADDYGGAGSDGAPDGSWNVCGGAGNPGGSGVLDGEDGEDGTGGRLELICGGDLTITSTGVIESDGMDGGSGTYGGGGGSGGGVIAIFYAGTLVNEGSIHANGGLGGDAGTSSGGAGAAGTIIGPYKIDAA
jgi:hypothetical protein